MSASICSHFESAFDIPFSFEQGLSEQNPWYTIGPAGNLRQFFKLSIKFVNDVRLTMELIPDSYSVPFINDLGHASEEQKRIFCSFAEEFIRRRAKISFFINRIPQDPCCCRDWPDEWSHVSLRISRSPISSDEKIDYKAVILDWGITMMGMVLSLATLVPLIPEEGIPVAQVEGAEQKVWTTRYERSPVNRALCLAAKGYSCSVCNMNFKDAYGDMGYLFIHVHHAFPVSLMEGEHLVDPIKELFPVCPNCHAMLHRTNPPMSIDELKQILESSKNSKE